MLSNECQNFVVEHPTHPLSAKLFFCLSPDDQERLIVSIVENAAFSDSWITYFTYAAAAQAKVSRDVAFEAVRHVGLDPFSAQLWITAASICESAEDARELYQLGLSVPLFEWDALYRAYCNFEVENNNAPPKLVGHFPFLQDERWPSRYAPNKTKDDLGELFHSWQLLIQNLGESLQTKRVDFDMQCRRIDVAFRQMCIHLPQCDSCYYQYALFQVKLLNDNSGAIETLRTGLEKVNSESFSLQNLLHVLCEGNLPEPLCSDTIKVLAPMRALGEKITKSESSEQLVKDLRSLGKRAASSGLGDWKVYSQWFEMEHLICKDSRMASVVLKNGGLCCSRGEDDGTLLANEALSFHLSQRNETETRGCSEHLVDLSRKCKNYGTSTEAWNTLLKTENLLNSFVSSESRRRKELGDRSEIESFMDRYRVGIFAPCSAYAAKWFKFTQDFQTSWNHEHNAAYDCEIPSSGKAISFASRAVEPYVMPQWSGPRFAAKSDGRKIPDSNDPDEIVGPRSFRGRLIYHLKVNKMTAFRVRKEQKISDPRKKRATEGLKDSPIGHLVHGLKQIVVDTEHPKRQKKVSFQWLADFLSRSELELNTALKSR